MLRDAVALRAWAPDILLLLGRGATRYNRLLEGIEGISDRILTQRLQELERDGLLVRQVIPGPPIRVTYTLTSVGFRLVPHLKGLDVALSAQPGLEEAQQAS